MKTIALFLFACLPSFWASAQENSIPAVDLRDIDGKIISSKEIITPGVPTLLVFWNPAEAKCCENLAIMAEGWEETLKLKGVKMVAICTDCNGCWSHVKPIVNGNSWDFDAYIDVNCDYKRAMCVGEGPCTLIFDQNQNLVCRYNSACTGDQNFICNNILDHLNLEVTATNFDREK